MPSTSTPVLASIVIATALAGCGHADIEPGRDTTAVSAAGHAAATGDAGTRGRMLCGDQPVLVSYADGTAQVTVNDDTFEMIAVRAASGTRYAMPDNAATTWWSHGERAMLVLDGRRLPECVRPAARMPLRARGNEPFWHLDIAADAVVLNGLGPSLTARFDAPHSDRAGATVRYRAATRDGRAIEVLVDEQTCRDDMSGMPYPLAATVTLDGRTLRGCGGDPAWLLTGSVWQVEDIDAGGIIDRSYITLDFRPDGTLGGSTGCNRYRARWSLDGEGLRIDLGGSTRKACAPALMNQERKFLAVIGGASRFRLDPTGMLTVLAESGGSLSARLAGE